jgi:hypothetical protein
MPSSRLAIRSATTIVGRFVFAEGMVRITEASATNNRSTPWTAPRALSLNPPTNSAELIVS